MLVLTERWKTVEQLAFGPGTQLAVAYGSGLAVWDAAAGRQVARHAFSSVSPVLTSVGAVFFPPDGRAVYVFDTLRELCGYHLPGLHPEQEDRLGYYFAAAMSADGQRFVTAGGRYGTVVGQQLSGYRRHGAGTAGEWGGSAGGHVSAVAFFPDGDRLAVVTHPQFIGPTTPEVRRPILNVRRWPGGDVVAGARCDRSEAAQVVVSPGGGRVAVRAGTVILIWPATLAGEPARIKNTNRRHFTGMAFHPSGRWLAATGNDQSVKLYDPESLEVARTYTWGIGKLKGVAFSADGALAAAAGEGGRVVVWDVDE